MLRIAKLTDYGTVVLSAMAEDRESLQPAAAIAERTGLGLPTVSKVLKTLARAGLVTSCRGAHGGYALARAAEAISAADIIDAFEGPVAITECAGAQSQCGLEATCGVGSAWQRISAAIRRALEDVTLAELATWNRAALPALDLRPPAVRVPLPGRATGPAQR